MIRLYLKNYKLADVPTNTAKDLVAKGDSAK